jgi:hypothetical protein
MEAYCAPSQLPSRYPYYVKVSTGMPQIDEGL